MNYILITPKIRAELNKKFSDFKNDLNVNLTFKSFLQHTFNNNKRGILYNKVSDSPLKIKIWSSEIVLILEETSERNSFKTIALRESSFEKFNSMLRYCNILKGEWDFDLISTEVISKGDYDFLRDEESYNEKNEEFDKYHKYWSNYDLITKKKEEKSREQQEESITEYTELVINFDKEEAIIRLKDNKYKFKKSDRVRLSVKKPSETYNNYNSVLGEIIDVNYNSNRLIINFSNTDMLNKLHGNKDLKNGYVYIDISGTINMLNRQKTALKKLFTRDTANRSLKDFMPNIENASTSREISLYDEWDDSKSNLNSFQKNAIKGALSCEDIFLIQGPPGTGKTTVICEIIKEIANRNQNVLVSSQSHLAVDNVLQRIGEEEKIRAIRIGSEDKIELGCEKYLLNNRVTHVQERLCRNLIEFDKKKQKIVEDLNNIKELAIRYNLVKDKMKLLINLVENYNSHIKIKDNINEELSKNIKYKESLNKKITKDDREILENSKILGDIVSALNDYESNEEVSKFILKINDANISTGDLEQVENFSTIVSVLQLEIKNYKDIENKRYVLCETLKRYEVEFDTIREQIISLSDQYELTESTGVRSAITNKIEILKEDLREIKDNYTQDEFKLRKIDLQLQEKMTLINECKMTANLYKEEIEKILINNAHICKSKAELLEVVNIRNYLLQKFDNQDIWHFLKWIDRYNCIKEVNAEVLEISNTISKIEESLSKENRMVLKLEEKLNEYGEDESIKYILENENIDILDVNKNLIMKLDELNISYTDLNRKLELIEKTNDLRSDLKADLDVYQSSFEDMYVGVSNVICSTCSGIAGTNNNNFISKEFDYVIVDEAAKCFSSELLIPMIKGKKIILVGDHKQISPIVEKDILLELEKESLFEDDERELYYSNSLFGITFEQADSAIKNTLSKQYRMNSDISMFVSKQFYKNELRDGENIIDIYHGIQKLNRGLYFISSGDEKESRETLDGTSFYNEKETKIIIKSLNWLDKQLKVKKEIGVISPYKAQKDYLIDSLGDIKFKNIELEINTIDAFQGREKDIIIMNLVRNNEKGEFGHVSGNSRVNVALSRATELCFVIGNESFILNNKHRARSLYNLLSYSEENNMKISEGYIDILDKEGNENE